MFSNKGRNREIIPHTTHKHTNTQTHDNKITRQQDENTHTNYTTHNTRTHKHTTTRQQDNTTTRQQHENTHTNTTHNTTTQHNTRKKERKTRYTQNTLHKKERKMEGTIEEEEIPTGNSGLTHIVTDVEMMSLGLLTGLRLWCR
jgi:hypothetical protein